MELKTTGTPRQCDACGKLIPVYGMSLNACGDVFCVRCMGEVFKTIDDLVRPSLEFSRETFVKLP